ncbi:threonine synthase [Bacillus subtilis]|nr:threonine synthase [Bacillus subtilis]
MELMWKGLIHQYKEFLPVTDQTPALTLHEGNTPLIHLPKLSEQLGIELHVKNGRRPILRDHLKIAEWLWLWQRQRRRQ